MLCKHPREAPEVYSREQRHQSIVRKVEAVTLRALLCPTRPSMWLCSALNPGDGSRIKAQPVVTRGKSLPSCIRIPKIGLKNGNVFHLND